MQAKKWVGQGSKAAAKGGRRKKEKGPFPLGKTYANLVDIAALCRLEEPQVICALASRSQAEALEEGQRAVRFQVFS